MTTIWQPGRVSDELVSLTRSLGDPSKDLAILAEGNTSERLEDGRIAVKVSGANLAASTREDFVIAEVEPLLELITSPRSTQADLTAALDAGDHGGRHRRGSIETLIHVAVQAVRPVTFIAHTHPTDVVALLASVHAAYAFDQAVYSDEAVVVGVPMYVPYAQPGIDLGRVFWERLTGYVAAHGDLPSLVLLGNHGIVAIADTAAGAEAVSVMAVKGARVRLGAYAAGGVVPLTVEATTKYLARDDIAERRTQLSGTGGTA